jgi:hypothetical protein
MIVPACTIATAGRVGPAASLPVTMIAVPRQWDGSAGAAISQTHSSRGRRLWCSFGLRGD